MEVLDGEKKYNLLQVGSSDIDKQNLASLRDRSIKGVQGLLNNDKLVLRQDVLVDGKKYMVFAQGPEIIFVVFDDGGKQYKTETDAQGKMILTIPQTTGPAKVYVVTINTDGTVGLTFQPPVLTMAELWNKYDVMTTAILEAGAYDPVDQVARRAWVAFQNAVIAGIAEATPLGYTPMITRLVSYKELAGLIIEDYDTDIFIIDDLNNVFTISNAQMNERLDHFRTKAQEWRTLYQSFPQDPIFTSNDQEFLNGLPEAEDFRESLVIAVEFAHLEEPFLSLPQTITAAELRAMLNRYKADYQILESKAVKQFKLSQTLVDKFVVEYEHIVSQVEAGIKQLGG